MLNQTVKADTQPVFLAYGSRETSVRMLGKGGSLANYAILSCEVEQAIMDGCGLVTVTCL